MSRERVRDLDALRRFALELADVADAITRERFGGRISAQRKPDGTPVTEVDRAVEAALRERIAAAHPDHAILGEEQGGVLDPAVPTWVIDPIDATKNFMRGVPVFATLIALCLGGHAIVGVASAPALGERWDAARGAGARRNGRLVRVSDVAELAEAHVLHGGLDWFRREPGMWDVLGHVVDRAGRTRGFGDFWMHLLVAGGHAEAAFERDLSVWDVAALECLVTEAGGRCTTWDGGSALSGGDVLTSNGLVHDELSALLTRR
ncbi:MAG TPA: inositol monophosphatase family protein [Egibacteraceae bacterium]